jgi:hypothetical protein
MGADGFAFEAARAESEEKIAQNQASQLRKQLASVQQFASELRARIPGSTTSGQTSAQGASAQTGTASVPSAPEPTTAAAPAPVSADEASSVAWLNQIVQWGKQNWYLVAAAVVVLLWLVSRAIGR